MNIEIYLCQEQLHHPLIKEYNMIDRFFVDTFTLESVKSGLTTLSTPSQTNSVSLTLSEEANVGVRISGFTDGSGSITLQGSSTESLTFPANGELISLNTFTSITTVLTNNLTDESEVGIIELFLSSPTGSPITFRETVDSYRGRISHRKRSFEEVRSGIEVNTNPILFTSFDIPAEIKDYIRVVGRTYEILGINYPSDLFGLIDHQEIELLEIPTA